MADQAKIFNWQKALSDTYLEVVQTLKEYLPQIAGAVVLLLIGILAAYLLRLGARKLTLAVEGLIRQPARQGVSKPRPGRTYSKLVGNVVFWSILLFFLAASAHLLDWKIFSDFLGKLLTYLPHLLAGLLIILAGFILGGVVGSLVETAADSTGLARPEILARIAQTTVVVTALVIGLEQFGIDVTFVTTSIIVVAGVLLFGAALAFGLGARHYVANLIGSQVSTKHFQVGQRIKLPTVEGYLLEITQTTLVLDSDRGRVVVPASLLQEQVSEIIAEADEPGDSGGSGGSVIMNLFRKKEDPDGSV